MASLNTLGVDVTDPNAEPETPPEPATGVVRTGQVAGDAVHHRPVGIPTTSGFGEYPDILLQGARDAQHSELTWKLISKYASVAEDEKDRLREERDAARRDTETWRGRATALSEELVALKARWESVSTLTNVQALLYVVGGLLLGPALQDLLTRKWVPGTATVGILGAAAVAAAFMLGRIGPRRDA
ncbi:MAG: hypothetical protein IPK33_03330 [Gemmatimonadetes bacterium]|nr:hypothetical protein [Gemmatimonadota bacterium]MBK8056934.1 hypothetical protein [Gemmatimonadota bacterium]